MQTCIALIAATTAAGSSRSSWHFGPHADQHISAGDAVLMTNLTVNTQAIDSTGQTSIAYCILLLCSARLCLPWKLAQILEGTRAKGSAEQTSMASALVDMFPSDLAPLIDMSGKIWAHTVSTLASCRGVSKLCLHFGAFRHAQNDKWQMCTASCVQQSEKCCTLASHA